MKGAEKARTNVHMVQPKLLIVDDQDFSSFVMVRHFKSLDIDIIQVKSGQEAIDIVQDLDFFLIIMDVQMPGMNGFEAATHIRQQKKNNQLPIIFLSACNDMDDFVIKGYETGAVDYLIKPPNINILIYKIGVFKKLWLLQQERIQDKKDLKLLARLEQEVNRNLQNHLNTQKFALDKHCLISIADLQGIITHANEKLCEVSQYSAAELIGQDHKILNSGHHPKSFMKKMWDTIKSGEIWQGEICNKTKNGSLYWVNATIVGFKDTSGKIVEYIAIRTDITAKKSALQTAIDANNAKSQFLASMSHEIRTPLNSIIGYSDLLSEDELSTDQRNMAGAIKNSSETLLSLVNDLLDLAKIESGEMTLESIPVNFENILFEVGSSLATKINNKQLEINIELNDVYALAYSDPIRLKQVFVNLAGNAMKFTDTGSVTLFIEELDANSEEMELKFTVHDTGIGISEDQAKVIFDPFKQADGSTTRKYGGTGLGLNISKQILKALGSDLKLKSTLGKGSEFYFTLKLKKYFPEVKESLRDTSLLQTKKVLIVDDNQIAANVFRRYIEKLGLEYSLAYSVPSALEILKEHKFDFVVQDIMMPDIDGYTLAAILKKEYPELKLIAVTADIRKGTISRIKSCAFDAYLLKPVRRKAFYDALINIFKPQEKSIKEEKIEESSFTPAALLVVDDNLMNRTLAEKMFTKMGHWVDLADSGKDAIEKASKKNYDIIFMDMQMPEMSGPEATIELRKLGVTTTIIALTANAFDEDKMTCINAGMNAFVSKPLRRNELHSMIQMYVSDSNYSERRLLIVEDDETTAILLSAIIKETFPELLFKVANTGVEALTLIGSFLPHYLILDFMLPDINGMKVLEFLRGHNQYNKVKVLINSSLNENDERIQRVSELGVSGFSSKKHSAKDKIINFIKTNWSI